MNERDEWEESVVGCACLCMEYYSYHVAAAKWHSYLSEIAYLRRLHLHAKATVRG